MDSPILPILLTCFGAVIMLSNIFKFIALKKVFHEICLWPLRNTRILLSVYFVLLVFFLLGYLFIAMLMLHPIWKISELLVSFILFFGSIFVTLSIAIQLYLCRSVQQSNFEITSALINAIEARDPNLNGHSVHVANLSVLIYQYLPIHVRFTLKKDDLHYAGLLHDIGKIGVAESILNKAGSLSMLEWEEIKKHPLIGYNILCKLEHFQEIAKWVLYHHERIDGMGYNKLPGDKIPLPSRIISVADTYSAITMTRSYHKSKSHEQAIRILRECRGSQLDTEIVNVFLNIPEDEVSACKPVLTPLESMAVMPN